LRFDFALTDAVGHVRVADIGKVMLEHLASSDPLIEYAERLAAGALPASLLGMLNGSIDLVVRHPSRPDEYVIADYKSNRLPRYDQATIHESMIDHHYPLQGILYSVALYRFLRWRLGESDPSPRLAGFAYLYIRGMTGPATPIDAHGHRDGVFHWQAPAGLVPALSDMLSGVVRV
jgi:exodeoxyribonuclease V beta subunit